MQAMQAIAEWSFDDPYMRMTPEQRLSETKRRRESFFSNRPRPLISPQPTPRRTEPVAPPIPDSHMAAALDVIEKWRMPRTYVETIQWSVLDQFRDVTIGDIKSIRRTKNIVHPRQLAMFMVKLLTNLSLPAIGRKFGGRDHTTVLHAVRKIDKQRQRDPALAAQIELIRARVAALAGGE